MEQPLVSVVMPTYHSEKHLARAISSILIQTYKNLELIIVSDEISEREHSIIREYCCADSRISHIENKTRLGLVKSLNLGISVARGKYIARMDADDYSYPQRIEKQVAYMEEHPEVGVCGAGYIYVDKGIRRKPIFLPEHTEDIVMTAFLWGCPICHPVVMMRADFLKTLEGPYSGKYPQAEDYYQWIRCIGKTKMVNLQKVLLDYHITGENICSVFTKSQSVQSAAIKQEAAAILGFPMRRKDEPLELWYLRLKAHNDEHLVFNKTKFNTMLAEGYYDHCLRFCRYGMKAWVMYWSSPLSWLNKLTLKRKVKFFGACILHKQLGPDPEGQ